MLIKKTSGPAAFTPIVNCIVGTQWVEVPDAKGKVLIRENPLYTAKEESKKPEVIANPEPLVEEEVILEEPDETEEPSDEAQDTWFDEYVSPDIEIEEE